MTGSAKKSENAYFYLLIPLLIYTLKAVVLMRGGAIYGRLAIPPPYDDVTYFEDAVERVRIFFDQGFYGYIESLIRNPPHAPYSTIAASVAFLFGGPNLAGPYILNGVMAALLSSLLFRLFRLPGLTTWCTCVVLITTRWFDDLVTLFHPDLISGLGAGIMAAVLIWQSEILNCRPQTLLAGTAGGVILLIKPVAFSMLTILWVLSFLIGAALDYREEKSLKLIGMRGMFVVLPILVIAGPYFAHELRPIIDYAILAFVRQRETWLALVPSEQRSLYYLNEVRSSFEGWFFVASGGSLGIVAFASYLGDSRTALRFVGLILLTLVAYFLPASVEVKTYLFGGVFYGCVAVCLVLVIYFLTDRLGPLWLERFQLKESTRRNFWVLALVLIGCIAVTDLADRQGRYPPETISALRAEYDGIYRLLREARREGAVVNGSQNLLTYFPCPAPIAPNAFRFRALLDGLDIGQERSSPHESKLQVMLDLANLAGVIIVPDDESLKSIYSYPVNKLIPAFRAWLDRNTSFKRFGTVQTSLGGTDVFAKVSLGEGAPAGSPSH
jgi:hypothetical protein